jgi:4-hydroxy-tetrahydrodipicolinate synthase
MIRHALNGDFQTATQEHLALLSINDLLYIEGNPAGIKAALKIKGVCRKEVRLPLVPLSDKNYSKLKQEIEIYYKNHVVMA